MGFSDWLGDVLDWGGTWGDLGIDSSTEGTSDWGKDIDAAYDYAMDVVAQVGNAQGWDGADMYNAQYWIQNAKAYSGGTALGFWSYLNDNWPSDSSVSNWNKLADVWDAAAATAGDIEQMESGGTPDPDKQKKIKWLLIGAVALGVIIVVKRA